MPETPVWKSETGRPTGTLVPLWRERSLAVSPDGHYRGTPGIESELVNVVETDQGQETLTPAEFARRYNWKNDPDKVRLLGDNVTDEPDIEPLPPPQGATVLFDGKNLDAWQQATGKVVEGFLEAGADDLVSREKFAGPFRLHVDFRLPRPPVANAPGSPKDAPDSARSGILVQGRYLLPITDSDGQPPNDTTTTGAIYRKKAPSSRRDTYDSPTRVAHPAGVWQSLQVDFEPPVVENGKVTEPARLTVRHNGFTIHDKFATAPTERAYDYKAAQPGPVVLQGNAAGIQVRNVWVERLEAAP